MSWNSLSEREQSVLKLVALGHTSAEIAESLSAKTVETYRARHGEIRSEQSRCVSALCAEKKIDFGGIKG